MRIPRAYVGQVPMDATEEDVVHEMERVEAIWLADHPEEAPNTVLEEWEEYTWAWSDDQPDINSQFYVPRQRCSPLFVSPAVCSGSGVPHSGMAAFTWGYLNVGEFQEPGPYLWAHLGRGWMRQGRMREFINDRIAVLVLRRDEVGHDHFRARYDDIMVGAQIAIDLYRRQNANETPAGDSEDD